MSYCTSGICSFKSLYGICMKYPDQICPDDLDQEDVEDTQYTPFKNRANERSEQTSEVLNSQTIDIPQEDEEDELC